VKIKTIKADTFLNYFQNLWTSKNYSFNRKFSNNKHTDFFEELVNVLKHSKNGRATGEDGINRIV
jgi:hypothetical protein